MMIKEIMKDGLRRVTGLTDGAVFSMEASPGAVALILVHCVPHTHTSVLAGYIAAWVHCGKGEEGFMSKPGSTNTYMNSGRPIRF